MGKKIALIGGSGFIGINTARHFLQNGYQITILDNFSRRGTDINLRNLKNDFGGVFEIVKADIRHDHQALLNAANEHDAIIHLAAQVAVTTSIQNPRDDFEHNILGTLNILEAIRESQKKPLLIYASTNKVYGNLESLEILEKDKRYSLNGIPGINESHSLDFHSPYGCSKGAADQYVRDYARIFGLKTVVFRQSCIYGRHQFGIEDQGWVAWFTIATLLSRPIKIYGNGKQVRDLLYVDDLAHAYRLAVENPEKVSGKIYNIGGGKNNSLSLLEFFEILQQRHGIDVKYKFAQIRPGDQKIFISDNSKIKKDLDWEPKTSVEQGLKDLLEWTKENLDTVKSLY